MTRFKEALASKGALFIRAASVLLFAGGVGQAQTGQPSTMGNMPGMSGSSSSSNAKTQTSGTGTVVAVNAGQHKVTLDHGPIPAISWPAMKMEFPAAASVDLAPIKPGSKVQFTLSGANGAYTVQSISPMP